MLSGRAARLVAVAIGLGVLMQLVALYFQHDAPAAQIRYDLVLTGTFYVVVGILVVSQITPEVRLRWKVGPVVSSVATGVAVGVGFGTLLLFLASSVTGHLAPDPRAVVLVSEGDVAHILCSFLILCVAAPLVEETLFRGLLLESMRGRDVGRAVVLSSLAFALWHLMPASLVYYMGLGALLAWVYLRRGLIGSMTAHACFNGVILAAAVYLALSPGPVVSAAGLTMHAPRGWHQVATTEAVTASGVDVVLRGPDAATVVIRHVDRATPIPAAQLAALAASGGLSTLLTQEGLQNADSAEVTTPVGPAVEAIGTEHGEHVDTILLPVGTRVYVIAATDGGDAAASHAFRSMVASLQLSPA